MEWKDLKINPEYEKALPKLTPAEFEALKESIKSYGLQMPLIINGEGTILDGHNRYRISEMMKFTPKLKTTTVTFEDPLEEEAFVISVNLQRRNLNDFQKAEMGMALLEVEKKLAQERKLLHAKSNEPISSDEVKGSATRIVAKKVGLSGPTFERAKKVIEEGPEGIKSVCRSGTVAINSAYSVVKAFQDVPEEPKKTLTELIVTGLKEPNEVVSIIQVTKAVKEKLISETEEIQEKMEPLFKDLYYTDKLSADMAIYMIAEEAEDPHPTITKTFPIEKFKDFDEAQAWAVERNGVCLGEVKMWKIELDPVKDKKLKEEKENE